MLRARARARALEVPWPWPLARAQMENHGLAIADATVALELDKSFFKAYYRRGSAYMALARYKDALKDFKAVRQLKPSDKDALEKFKAADKEVRAPTAAPIAQCRTARRPGARHCRARHRFQLFTRSEARRHPATDASSSTVGTVQRNARHFMPPTRPGKASRRAAPQRTVHQRSALRVWHVGLRRPLTVCTCAHALR
eukprot:5654696-Prymnesium_polylepis.2